MPSSPDDLELPLDVLERIDRTCARFEARWRAGEVPRLRDYLNGVGGPERRLLFRELILADAELRQAHGLPSPLDAYGGQYPEYRDVLESLVLSVPPEG